MALKYTNNAQSTLDLALSAAATSLVLAAGEGDRFPSIVTADGDWFPLTLIKADGTGYEIVWATNRVADTVTITRGQEDTPTALDFIAGDIVSHRMTSGAFDEFLKNGDTSAILPQGLNVAAQTNLLSQPYELELEGISELSDGLRIAFKPLVTNEAATVSIKLNNLDTKSVVVPYSVSTQLAVEDLRIDQYYEFQFSTDRDRWLLETPIRRDASFANALLAGTVATELSADRVFDTSANPESLTGAPIVFTRIGISKIIESYAKLKNIADKWRNFGVGTINSSITTAGGTFTKGGVFDNYKNFTVPLGEQLRCGNVSVIRASESITISGDVVIGHMTKSFYPVGHIGPSGADEPGGATGTLPTYLPQQERVYSGIGTSAVVDLINGVSEGESFSHFFGGHGRGNIVQALADSMVRGRGALILIAPLITIASTAKFYLPVRLSEANTAIDETNGQGVTDANASAGGGGLLILSTDSLVRSNSAQCKTHDPSAAYESFTAAAATGIIPLISEFGGAQTGKIFHIDLADSTFELIV